MTYLINCVSYIIKYENQQTSMLSFFRKIKLNLSFLQDIKLSMIWKYNDIKNSKYFQSDVYFFSFHFPQKAYTVANKKELTIIEKYQSVRL